MVSSSTKFRGAIVKPNESFLAKIPDGQFININNVALRSTSTKKGTKAVLYCMIEDTKHVLGTLTVGVCEQFSVDFSFSSLTTPRVQFGVEGPGEIHLIGFMANESQGSSDSDEEMNADINDIIQHDDDDDEDEDN